MGFEGLDHAFRYVAEAHVRGNKLEGCLPFLLDLQFVGGVAIVVEDFEVHGVAVFLRLVIVRIFKRDLNYHLKRALFAV